MFVILREIECGRNFSSMIFIGNCEIPHFIFYYKTGDRALAGKLLLVVRNAVSSGLFDKSCKNIDINLPPIYRLLMNAYWHKVKKFFHFQHFCFCPKRSVEMIHLVIAGSVSTRRGASFTFGGFVQPAQENFALVWHPTKSKAAMIGVKSFNFIFNLA